MTPKRCVSACPGFLVACLLALTLQIFFFSPISPDLLELPPPFSSASHLLPTNTHLQRVIKIGEGNLKDPEDVCVDRNDVVYTATRDGWVKRLHKNETWQDWKFIDTTHALLGITTTMENDLIGLLKASEDGVVTALASHVNGSKIWFTEDVIEASDGSLYFSVASTKFGLDNWYLDVFEAKPHGQYSSFANGVTLSREEDYLVVCETWKCLKYWLKGETKGETEIFVQNLPGGPDNINPRWLVLDRYTRADGNIIRTFQDPNGKVMSFVTSAFEFEDHLYLGSLNSNFIGKLPLKAE
ncbi:hypothetical protein Dsin_018078 [Dipteronia sinensis]|uniref:Strictosidine synthase conserved region domain-containing protein n=1 Tax=Dipteronia sinensis TaxID=43782 RepID=A0AAE0AHH2_9ROSI|nr:hypothetical protein Dsin_018078 [Dipteronia sinensis]